MQIIKNQKSKQEDSSDTVHLNVRIFSVSPMCIYNPIDYAVPFNICNNQLISIMLYVIYIEKIVLRRTT